VQKIWFEARCIYSSICMCARVCAVLEQKSHCAKWPVTEVFHVNPMIHSEPPRHRAHTCSNEFGLLLTPFRAYESAYTHTHTQTSEILWFDVVAFRHFPQCIQSSFRSRRLRKKSRDVLIEMITILFFTSVFCFIGT